MSRFNALPIGTYQKTSRDVQVVIKAKCRKIRQEGEPIVEQESELDITEMRNPFIVNHDGTLTSTRAGKPGDHCPFPASSYLPYGNFDLSSRDYAAILRAKCKKHDGSWVASQLDLTDYDPETEYIANRDGQLETFQLFDWLPSKEKIKSARIKTGTRNNRRVLATVRDGHLWDLNGGSLVLKYYFVPKRPTHQDYGRKTAAARRAFERWNDVDFAISFEPTTRRDDAHIRIDFDHNLIDHVKSGLLDFETRKPIGTSKNNMNLGMRKGVAGNAGYVTALHEIGHVLGFIHEFTRPDEKVEFNWPAVYSYYETRNPVPISIHDTAPTPTYKNITVRLYMGPSRKEQSLTISNRGDYNKYRIHLALRRSDQVLVAYREHLFGKDTKIGFDEHSVMNYDLPASCFKAPEKLAKHGLKRAIDLTPADCDTARCFYPKPALDLDP